MGGEGISITSSGGGLAKVAKRLQTLRDARIFNVLEKHAQAGVAALSAATPVESSVTANSWTYDIINESGFHGIRWRNTHMAGNTPVVILLQYGHGTGTGGYVVGRDFINPAIKPIFTRIKDDVHKAVSSA